MHELLLEQPPMNLENTILENLLISLAATAVTSFLIYKFAMSQPKSVKKDFEHGYWGNYKDPDVLPKPVVEN
jgi:hypothetical protein